MHFESPPSPSVPRRLSIFGYLCSALLTLAPMACAQQPRQTAPAPAANTPPQAIHTAPKASTPLRPHAGSTKTPTPHKTATALSLNPQVSAWMQEAASRLQLDPQWVQKTMASAQRLPQVEKWVLPPSSPTAKDWGAYRARFIDATRIQAGTRFWRAHQTTLERAEKEFGVPASIVVGIIGVETLYGQNTGNFRLVDALGTLAFHFPSTHPRATERQAFFRSELEHFLLLTSRSGSDPLSVRGSYAGAMGLPQFMPSSWAKYAVDFDGDGRIDLFGSPADAIGSVANYFKAFQWRTGMPTHYPVRLSAQTDMDSLLAPDILPTFSVSSFTAKGAGLEGAALAHTGPLALIELRNGSNAPHYVAGTENFYAITRYNWSSYYAMAVIDLAEAVAREVRHSP